MHVGVVGAGITGLAVTHHLRERGARVDTFETRDEPGGVVQSREIAGHTAEVGPQRMRATPGVRDLAAAVGVADDLVTAADDPLYVYSRGRLREAPTDADALLRTDLLSWPQKLRLLAEPLTHETLAQETVAGAFTRKFGRTAYERFIGPLYGGLYASDPAEMPAKFALSGLMERERAEGSLLAAVRQRVSQGGSPPASFPGGLQTLPEAVAATHADSVHLSEPVTDLTPTQSGYRLGTPDRESAVDAVVVTAPADAAADLLTGVVEHAGALRGLTYNPLALVYLDADSLSAGLGYQVAYDEDLHTLGVSFNGAMFDRGGLATAFLGGMHDPTVLDRSDAALGRLAREEFEAATGHAATVLGVERRDRWFPAYDHTWWGIEAVDTPADVHLATNYTARMGIPARVREAEQVADRIVAS